MSRDHRAMNYLIIIAAIAIFIILYLLFRGKKSVNTTDALQNDMCLFSSFTCHITLNGEPVKGAKIIRKVDVKNEDNGKFSDEALTDSQGNFSFPTMTAPFKTPALAELMIVQDMYVHYENKEYYIWTHTKMNAEEFADFGGTPENITCELTNQMKGRKLDLAIVVVSCLSWDINKKFIYYNTK